MKALFTSRNLLGDGLYVSAALRQWHREHHQAQITLETLPGYVKPIYSGMGVSGIDVTSDEYLSRTELEKKDAGGDYDLPFREEFDLDHTFDVSKAFLLSHEKQQHVAESYADLLGVELERKEDYSHVGPFYNPGPQEVEDELKGLILVSMFSMSCSSHQGMAPNKMLPWHKWQIILAYLRTLGLPIRFVGAPIDRAPNLLRLSEDEYLTGIPIPKLAAVMRHARLVVTLDNGMSHLAASQRTPTFLFYSYVLGTHFILPKGNPNLAYVHENPMTMDAKLVVRHMKTAVPLLLRRSEKREEVLV
jgi:ADP-heptose:LPS heptosyltransferase